MNRVRLVQLCCLAGVLIVLQGVPASGAAGAPPLIGVTFTHSSMQGCDLQNSVGIVARYDDPGERRLVRSQLAAMRASGIDSIRFVLWFMTDASAQQWGVISSSGGRVSEPQRSNLIRYVSDIRSAGFQRLTISFGPQWENDPIGVYHDDGTIEDHWVPAKLEENWSFIAGVHNLVKPYAPANTVFDVLSEIPPSTYQPQWAIDRLNNYIRTIWTRYADAFGLGDATISVITKQGLTASRLPGLIETLRSTGRSFPPTLEIHASWSSPQAYNELTSVDRTLAANGLSQPLVMGETPYEYPAVAADVARFTAESGRPVTEVYEWFATTEQGPCGVPPYSADAYIAALKHVAPPPHTPMQLLPVPTLFGTVTRTGATSLRTASGARVSTLDAGTYVVIVRDRSRRYGFGLRGPGFGQATGRRFVGRRTWHIELGTSAPYGSTFTYGSSKRRTKFVVH